MIGKWGFSQLPFYLGIIPIFANNNYTLTSLNSALNPTLPLASFQQSKKMLKIQPLDCIFLLL